MVLADKEIVVEETPFKDKQQAVLKYPHMLHVKRSKDYNGSKMEIILVFQVFPLI